MSTETTLPTFEAWSTAAVRLLQGPLYSDDKAWDVLLASQSAVEEWSARLGLILVVDEPEGLAYVRQMNEDETPDGYDQLPRLFRRSRLGYDTTLLCVLLREELRQFEDEDIDNDRCVVETAKLFELWKTFFPPTHDEVRLRKDLTSALRKLEDLRFVSKFSDEPPAWEIRRILKARLPARELENLKQHLKAAAEKRLKKS